jgi:hypothetical protein
LLPSKRTLTVRLLWIVAVTVPTLLASRGQRFAPSALNLQRPPTFMSTMDGKLTSSTAVRLRFLLAGFWGMIISAPVIQKAGDYFALHQADY